MSFFGDSLLEKGLITEQDLVQALVAQSNSLPSPLQIVHEENLLSSEEILNVISSRQAGESFLTACENLEIDTGSMKQVILERQKTERPPLGQILVDQFGVDLQVISGELQASEPEVNTSNSSSNPATEIENPASQDCNFSFPSVSGETKKQYLEFFSSQIKSSLEKEFHNVSKDNLSMIEETVQQLTAAASFARMEVSFTVCDKFIALIEKMIDKGIESFDIDEVKAICLSTLDVLWELHRFIDISGTEAEFWSNEVSRKNFDAAISNLTYLIEQGAKA